MTFHQGEVWYAYLGPVVGVEQDGRRPVLVVSNDMFNSIDNNLVWIVPLTRTIRGIGFHVIVDPPEGGLTDRSAIMCEQIRAVDRSRLKKLQGAVDSETMTAVLRLLSTIPRSMQPEQ
ncbi:MAG: type II toxin-antitoxin system PemK/MazF family toxin [Thermomicrobiales bacterium]|nr:type II toxin-antitoxin system PemK/MazF family toxin [Thermomicrobiales bacterium]